MVSVYIIAASDQGPVKIGYSADPTKRLAKLQTGHPDPLTLYHTVDFEAGQAKLIERIIHQTLKLDRQHGEWFSINVEQAMAELEFARIRYGEEKNLRDFL